MSTFIQRVKSTTTTLAVAIAVAAAGHSQAANLDIADVPLFLQTGVQPNLIMAIDDSGSMDYELQLRTNDGAAWFRRANSGSCGSTDINKFVGCIANASGDDDIASAGKLNFNNDGDNANGIWEKFTSLFPNGYEFSRITFRKRLASASAPNYYALAPVPALAWARAHEYNAAYFDPKVDYLPWPSDANHTFTDAPFTKARFDPVFGTVNDAFDLSKDVANTTQALTTAGCSDAALGDNASDNEWSFRVYTGMTIPTGACIRINGTVWETVRSIATCTVGASPNKCETTGGTRTIANASYLAIRYFPATFYVSSGAELPAGSGYKDTAILADGKAPDGSSLMGYEIKPANFEASTDGTTSYTAIQNYNRMAQNFANWFTYYRKRHQALRAGLGESFRDITGIRVASFRINDNTNTVTMRDIGTGTNRLSLYTQFYDDSTGNSVTPNRNAVANLIRNYRRSDAAAPVQFSCQKNFGMLFTDGFSDPEPSAGDSFSNIGNVDGSQDAPFKDSVSDTIADGVLNGYLNPLRTGFTANRVTIPGGCPDVRLDCNRNLHMNFYAVTLGTRGLRYDPDANPAQDPFTNPPAWPTSFPQRHPSAVDDLWHATINGRGALFNAKRPKDISQQLSAVLKDIVERTGSASSASVNSGSISDSTRVFQAKFDSSTWSGQLQAFPILTMNEDGTPRTDGALSTDDDWDAADKLPAAADRKIITSNSDRSKIAFKWANLDATRRGEIDPNFANDSGALGAKRVDYLRGDGTYELGQMGGIFRKRTSKLGDIIASAPLFVGKPPFFYPDTLETGGNTPTASDKTYSKFRADRKDRPAMVYAGANDGMLHAFDAATGVEKLAFIPSPVFSNLRKLSEPTYNNNHKFFVDGAPNTADAYFDGEWHTVLVGGLNKGGQGIYALDISKPETFGTAAPASIALWEFTDANDSDLGLTYSQPAIVRLQTGVWAAVFGNGYNNTIADSNVSATGNAVLYIVNIKTGALIKKFDTLKGSTVNTPNGMSTPVVVDFDGDSTADFIYAGDLYGNLWKFDISSTDSTQWGIDYGTAAAPTPLFATRATGTPSTKQPITSRPEVIRGPRGIGTMVLFGTGKYLETSDKVISPTNLNVQSYYGIVDSNTHTDTDVVAFANLTQQQIIAETTITVGDKDFNVRATSNNTGGTSGWYMNLQAPSGFKGERQVSNTVVRSGRAIFTTLIPDTDPCSSGGTSFLMELDALTGSRLQQTPFDVNQDGVFDGNDLVSVTVNGTTITVPVSGIDPNVGITPDPGILLSADGRKEYKYSAGTTGLIGVTTENPGPRAAGRQSWRQIR